MLGKRVYFSMGREDDLVSGIVYAHCISLGPERYTIIVDNQVGIRDLVITKNANNIRRAEDVSVDQLLTHEFFRVRELGLQLCALE